MGIYFAWNRKEGDTSIVAAFVSVMFALVKKQHDTTLPVARGLTFFPDLA